MERLSKNFIWTAAANIAGSFFGIVVFIYLARTLLPEAFGYFSYSVTLVFYLANFIDLGLSTYGIREISKERPRASEYASEIISLKLLVAAVLSLLFIVTVSLSPHSGLLKILLIETSLMFFVVAFSAEWPFQGLEKMHMVFVSFATTAVVQVILIFTFVKGPEDLLRVPVIYFISSVPVIIIFLRRLHFKLQIRRLDFKKIKFYL
ncbi:MAG: oligosaccharide flippase family protein, partial [Candidatus Omnitrophica bacterium]|nr:oligosaccharide flippase family protein [Candidatus Omnitrophota bacterium]